MKKLNNRGFAITAILYSLAAIICLVLFLILSTMAGKKKNNDDLVDSVKRQLTNSTMTVTVLDIKVPTKKVYGATWARVFHHNNQNGTSLFLSTAVGKVDSPYLQSILEGIDVFHNNDNTFEFLLEYPEVKGYNRWKQTDNPYTLEIPDGSATTVPGYEAIQISWTDNGWGGLAKSTAIASTYIDGSIGTDAWGYAIGAYTTDGVEPNVGIPGPNGTIIYGSVDLWIRIDDYLERQGQS